MNDGKREITDVGELTKAETHAAKQKKNPIWPFMVNDFCIHSFIHSFIHPEKIRTKKFENDTYFSCISFIREWIIQADEGGDDDGDDYDGCDNDDGDDDNSDDDDNGDDK